MFFLDFILLFFTFLFFIVFLFIGFSYLTLVERKVLGYIQVRKGPNKVGFYGLLQPFSDGCKLFIKEFSFPYMSNLFVFIFSPVFNFFLSLFLWVCIPYFSFSFSFLFSFLFFVCCSSMGVYFIMMSGWSSNSVYSFLGCIRSVSQTISYEVSLVMILLSFLFLTSSLNIFDFFFYQTGIWFFFLGFPLVFIFFSSLLAETNRSPFDFSEGESELVSGFNVEYSSVGFALIFMSEYSNILFMSVLFSFFFLGGYLYSLLFFLFSFFLSFLFIWVRGTFPRLRYDKLMYLSWKVFLPISLNFLFFFSGFSFLIFSLLI